MCWCIYTHIYIMENPHTCLSAVVGKFLTTQLANNNNTIVEFDSAKLGEWRIGQ